MLLFILVKWFQLVKENFQICNPVHSIHDKIIFEFILKWFYFFVWWKIMLRTYKTISNWLSYWFIYWRFNASSFNPIIKNFTISFINRLIWSHLILNFMSIYSLLRLLFWKYTELYFVVWIFIMIIVRIVGRHTNNLRRENI
jgi:hypothetical protein